MKFAFSTTACPHWDFETIAERAREYGYDGVTLHASTDEAVFPNSNVFLSDSEKIRAIFEEQKIDIPVLSCPVGPGGRANQDYHAADIVRRLIDRAATLAAPMVRIRDIAPVTGRTAAVGAGLLAQWLVPLADYAAEKGVTILVANTLSLRHARDIWRMLETLSHPSVGCAWDVLGAMLAGEAPSVSIPTLNQRLGQIIVRDARLIDHTATLCQMGSGDVPIQKALTLLRGIGYRGWVSFDWPRSDKPVLDAPEEALPEAIRKMREWIKPPEPPAKPKPAPKPAVAKPAATAT